MGLFPAQILAGFIELTCNEVETNRPTDSNINPNRGLKRNVLAKRISKGQSLENRGSDSERQNKIGG
jgi:hypothetical protein